MKRFEPEAENAVNDLSGRAEREAHLAHVAATTPLIVLHIGDQAVHGRFLPPTPSGGLPFRVNSDVVASSPPAAGSKVTARYHAESGVNAFETEVISAAEDGDWQLALPATIASADRRNAPRFSVDHEPAFGLKIRSPEAGLIRYRLRDISTSGTCIRVRLDDPPLDAERIYDGELQLPLIETIPVRVHIVRIHDETEAGDKFCGARFMDMPLEARNDLALALTRWDFLANDENAGDK